MYTTSLRTLRWRSAARTEHGLIHRIADVRRYIGQLSVQQKHKSIPWLAYSFQPFDGLIEPFQIYPGRYWVFQQMHKQASGLPERLSYLKRVPWCFSHCGLTSTSDSAAVKTLRRGLITFIPWHSVFFILVVSKRQTGPFFQKRNA